MAQGESVSHGSDPEGSEHGNREGEMGKDKDFESEGWSPKSGGASERVKEANRKAWEANDTQDASRGTSDDPGAQGSGSDMAPDDVGESVSRRGEDVAKNEDEAGREDMGTKGKSQRPVGTSTGRDSTSVKPDEGGPSSDSTSRG